jgi:hypothetical protein
MPPPDAGDAWEPPRSAGQAGELAAARPPKQQQVKKVGRPAEVPRDILECELPGHLRDLFADTFYDDALSDLTWMERHARSKTRVYALLNTKPTKKTWVQQVREFAEATSAHFEKFKPYCVCPECKGKEHGCTHCDHKGWMCLDDYHTWKADQDTHLTAEAAAAGSK